MSVECQVNVKSQSELDIGGRETCLCLSSPICSMLGSIALSGIASGTSYHRGRWIVLTYGSQNKTTGLCRKCK